jgi:hypothetical protein
LTAALCAALLLAPAALAAATFDPVKLGAAPGGDPAANTRAIQAALDAAGAAGGGTVALTRRGVYDLAAQGPNPNHKGHRYCLELRHDGLTLRIGPGVTLRLADRQQADTWGPVDVVMWSGRRDLRVTGGGTLSGNTAGQVAWSRGYSQITHGNILAGYWGPSVRNERIRIDGVTLEDHFSNAIYLSGHPDNRDRGVRISEVRVRDTGEGPLVMNTDDVTLDGNTYENVAVGVHPGDAFELWNVAGFRVTRTTVRGRLGGSAIDLYGARDGIVDGFTVDGGVEGVAIQENTSMGTYSEQVQVRNGKIRLAGAGSGVFTRGARVRQVTVSAVEVLGDSIPQTIGFQISKDDPGGRPADDWRQQGPVTLEGCVARANDVGLLIKTVADLTVSGGDFSGNDASPLADGIRWMGQANAVRRADTRGLVLRGVRASGNRHYGIRLDGQGFRGRAPSGSFTGCTLVANGSGGLLVTKAPDRDLVTDVVVDATCRVGSTVTEAP